MKIAQISDIHININATELGKYKLDKNGENLIYKRKLFILNWCVEQAINNKVDEILLTGDIFDKSKPFPREYMDLEATINKVKSKVKILYGNHDEMTNKGCGLEPLQSMGYKVALDYDTWDGFIYLCPWGKLDLTKVKSGIVLALHAGVKTSDYDWVEVEGETGNVRLEDLVGLNCRAIMLGHHHNQTELAPKIWYAGSVACETFGEENDSKGMLIWDITNEETKVTQISTSHLFPEYKTFTPEEFLVIDQAPNTLMRVKGEVTEKERLDIIKKLKDFDCLDFKLDLNIKYKNKKIEKLSGTNDSDILRNYLTSKQVENVEEIIRLDKELYGDNL